MAKITVYDGARTIGGNKIYFEEGDEGLFLDFGMNFKKYGEFFQEFLNLRSTRGIHDLITLNLIPKLNIYRKDLIPSDLDVSIWKKLNISGVLLTHAHVDHFGNIGLLSLDIPIVATPITIALLKGIIDCTQAKLGMDASYFSPKDQSNDGRILKANRKTEIRRDIYSTTKVSEDLKNFMEFCPKKNKTFINSNNLFSLNDFTTNFNIKSFNLDHSIYGAAGYTIYGDKSLAYTGDFRLHGTQTYQIKDFIKEAKNCETLVIEGTRTSRDEDDNVSEEEVYKNCLKICQEAKGLIIADFTSRNFERLETFKKIAVSLGRNLIITKKDAYLLNALKSVDGIDRLKNLYVFGDLKENIKNWETKIIENTNNEIFLDPLDISKNPDNCILCFSLYDMKNILDIKPNGGTYIYSSSEPFEEESEFDFIRLYNWLKFFDFSIHGFKIIKAKDRIKTEYTNGFHASGHTSTSDLIKVINEIDPDHIIPVHTENPKWFEDNFNNVILPKEGKKIIL
ncbi:MAG: MBL fold metallo-hydrolase RNA specificity domain-containing protein [Promethearchaeota archaeon]